jgi:hypothetical protein
MPHSKVVMYQIMAARYCYASSSTAWGCAIVFRECSRIYPIRIG